MLPPFLKSKLCVELKNRIQHGSIKQHPYENNLECALKSPEALESFVLSLENNALPTFSNLQLGYIFPQLQTFGSEETLPRNHIFQKLKSVFPNDVKL